MCCFPLAAFKILFFFFIFRSLIVMCLGMGFFGFILFGINSASWICRLMSFATFEKFSVIISLNPLSAIVSFSSETLMWQMLDLLLLPHRSLKFFFFCLFLFSFVLFQFLFFLLFRMCIICYYFLKFTNLIISHLHSTIDPIQYLKIPVIGFFSSSVSHWFLFIYFGCAES